MQKLSFIILFSLFSIALLGQDSPHGKDFDLDCLLCHTTESWEIDKNKIKFDHSSTKFKLMGQHKDVNCSSCHTDLKFKNTSADCENCHTDVHENSVGLDCANCHTPTSWIVSNILQIHRMSRFPLLGSHQTSDCSECHVSNSLLNFQPLGVECSDCHMDNYLSAKNPDHVSANYSTDCIECHNQSYPSWKGAGIVHDFFPLTGGHAISDCFECHSQDGFTGLSPDCFSCHQDDYNATANPSHLDLGFSHDCQSCHTIDGWKPATFDHDNKFFPIYSGSHSEAWNNCSDCHTNSNDYTVFSCLTCHEHNQTDTNNKHREVNGYVYESNACYSCHPSGSEDDNFSHTPAFPLTNSHSNLPCSECHSTTYAGTSSECVSCHLESYNSAKDPDHVAENYPKECETCHSTTTWNEAVFDHSTTNFQLTGAHAQAQCSDCHTDGYTGLETACASCHQTDFNGTTNPSHTNLSLALTCETCHTTGPGWSPAKFPDHNNYFQLLGAHSVISDNCSDCHNGNYNSTPDQCYGCHSSDYDNSTNPSHSAAQFPTDCQECHSQNAWVPSTFEHDSQYFPIYSGKHRDAWNNCSDCHTNASDYGSFSCIDCHEHNKADTDNDHSEVANYQYQSTACFDCHPNGTGDGAANKFFKIYKIIK